MKNTIQKTTVALIASIAILLVSGNALLAQDQNTGDLITAADLAFIKADPEGTAAQVVTSRQAPSAGLIGPTDYAFVARQYSESTGSRQVSVTFETTGIITAVDYRFLTTGQEADLFSAYNDFADSLAGRIEK